MTHAQAKSELMQIYMSLSEEKKKAIDVAIEALEQEPNTVIATGDGADYKIKALQADGEKSFKMRDATPEEQEAIDKYIKSISKPTGVNFWDLADGDLINKNNAITSVCQWGTTLERTGTYTITVAEMKQTITDMLCELPTVAIPQNNNGCENCRWQSQSESEMPCKQCMHNYTDEWEMEKPTDTITMEQEPKTGHWKRISIDKYSEHAKYWYRCDRCGKDNLGNTDWCPNCGVKMIEPQERSENVT